MVSEKVRVINKEGMHMRPAGLIAQTCGLMKSSVRISYNGKFYDCKSIIMLMSAGIGYGAELEVIAEGEDEEEALKEVVDLFHAGLGDRTA
jgi:phosphocarrier protein HPr